MKNTFRLAACANTRDDAAELARALRNWVLSPEPEAPIFALSPGGAYHKLMVDSLQKATSTRATDPASSDAIPALVDPEKPRLVVATSGSSSAPDLVALSRDAVKASAAATNLALGVGDWVLALPLRHIAGAQVVLRPSLAGRDVVIPKSWPNVTAVDLARCAQAGARYVSLVSQQLQDLLSADPATMAELRKYNAILVGGGRIDPDALRLSAELGLHVMTTYGMTETAGGCVYNAKALPGTVLEIEDGTSQILVSTPGLMDGYLNRPSPIRSREGKRWFSTGDLGSIDDGVLQVAGRMDRTIKSGGAKVNLDRAEAVVSASEGVAEAACVGLDDPRWGHTVAALVVPAEMPQATSELAQSLHLAVKEQLGSAHAPRIVVFTDRLARTGLGKLQRREVQQEVSRAISQGRAWRR